MGCGPSARPLAWKPEVSGLVDSVHELTPHQRPRPQSVPPLRLKKDKPPPKKQPSFSAEAEAEAACVPADPDADKADTPTVIKQKLPGVSRAQDGGIPLKTKSKMINADSAAAAAAAAEARPETAGSGSIGRHRPAAAKNAFVNPLTAPEPVHLTASADECLRVLGRAYLVSTECNLLWSPR
eukprot:m51a1_g5858 hypothetical protein (182) ;mRNA; f:375784-376615